MTWHPFRVRTHITKQSPSGSAAHWVSAPVFWSSAGPEARAIARTLGGELYGWRVFRHTNDTSSAALTFHLVDPAHRDGQTPGDDAQISALPLIASMTADGKTAGDTLDLGQDRRTFLGLVATVTLTTSGVGRVALSTIAWGRVDVPRGWCVDPATGEVSPLAI